MLTDFIVVDGLMIRTSWFRIVDAMAWQDSTSWDGPSNFTDLLHDNQVFSEAIAYVMGPGSYLVSNIGSVYLALRRYLLCMAKFTFHRLNE